MFAGLKSSLRLCAHSGALAARSHSTMAEGTPRMSTAVAHVLGLAALIEAELHGENH